MHSQQAFNECIAKASVGGHGTRVLSRGWFLLPGIKQCAVPRTIAKGLQPPNSPTVERHRSCRTSQQRTRRRKRITSDCFFF